MVLNENETPRTRCAMERKPLQKNYRVVDALSREHHPMRKTKRNNYTKNAHT